MVMCMDGFAGCNAAERPCIAPSHDSRLAYIALDIWKCIRGERVGIYSEWKCKTKMYLGHAIHTHLFSEITMEERRHPKTAKDISRHKEEDGEAGGGGGGRK